MKFTVICEQGGYAVIDRGKDIKEIALVRGLNKEKGEWDYTCKYYAYEYKGATCKLRDKACCIALAMDKLCAKTVENYISRDRLEELAIGFAGKFRLMCAGMSSQDIEDEVEVFELTKFERDFLGFST